jgi:tRNA nucleotidyltransferase (CCA-adding enzyme)
MRVYLVGGFVRDTLLGLEPKERDWVIVGGDAESLMAQGYRRVGKDFPVFLHPVSAEEYALARCERKIAPGYGGFAFETSPDVSLEEDLKRRDLTINAMARDAHGQLIDPYGGLKDLQNRCLRHVSDAFVEDPVRILRIARFMARFKSLGFTIASETLALMRHMVDSGEVRALVPERVFAELKKALGEPDPGAFFETLRACGALNDLFPEIERLFGVPQSPEHHPEIDTGLHTLRVLDMAAGLTGLPQVRFAALVHDLGKGVTPSHQWPRHPGHERRGIPVLQALCQRLRIPLAYQRLAERVVRYHGHAHRCLTLSPGAVVDLLQRLDALRQPQGLEDFILAVMADARGRPGHEKDAYPQADWLRLALKTIQSTALQSVTSSDLKGIELAQAIRKVRVAAVAKARSDFMAQP